MHKLTKNVTVVTLCNYNTVRKVYRFRNIFGYVIIVGIINLRLGIMMVIYYYSPSRCIIL